MSGRASPRAIGVFVIAAIGLAVGSVAVFGSGRLFHETHEFVGWPPSLAATGSTSDDSKHTTV